MRNFKAMVSVSGICAFIFISALIPYFTIPFGIEAAETEMIQTYGLTYTNLETSSMRTLPFSIFDNIYGFPIDESKFTIQTDILYLDNGNDSFYFDWYSPHGEGPFPVIIAIHGGAWVTGNKGLGNVIPFNKYFASQGYVVFDLQYGLFDIVKTQDEMGDLGTFFGSMGELIMPPYNQSYPIQQQLENIGYFTKILELNSSKYQADLDNVFIVGRSAGAHMASIVTLGHKNPLFAGNFSTTMNITGGIWFYPPTNLNKIMGTFMDTLLQGSLPLDMQRNKFSATYLINNSTIIPPILIVHGEKDKMVDYHNQVLEFYQLANELEHRCLMVIIPWGGHAFDINFQTYGGQMSTFYIERFMALEQLKGGS
jgi:acetyl esterase/lipase